MIEGSLFNRIMERGKQPKPEVGMGATMSMYTDRHAGTIIWVSKTGKTLKWQQDKATRTDKNNMSESQYYSYERNPHGAIHIFRLTKKGWRMKGGTFLIVGDRDEYYDFSF